MRWCDRSSRLYVNIEEILANYRTNLESGSSLTLEDQELIMQLSAAYLKRKEEWTEEVQLRSAVNLLREGVTPEIISKALGLSIEVILRLRDRL